MKTIEDLRNYAKLVLCETCFQKYKALIEPSIEDWLSNPMDDWKKVESHITQMVMKTEGIFKGNSNIILISLDKGSNGAFGVKVYEKGFKSIKKCSFKKKIDYLRKKTILQSSSYELLDKARDVRNKIHDDLAKFSEQDRNLFYIASLVTFQIWNATIGDWGEDISTNFKSNAEKIAKQCLLELDHEQ